MLYGPVLFQVLQDHGYSKACFIGHSYGTNYITWLNRHRPELLSSGVVLVDPIGFLLFEPDLIDNMLYQNSFSGPASFVIRRELYVRYTIQRHFWWMQNTLFPDSLPEKAAVMLGDRDNIVPTHKIYRSVRVHSLQRARENAAARAAAEAPEKGVEKGHPRREACVDSERLLRFGPWPGRHFYFEMNLP